MSNMSYCRFQNTLPDLQDCYHNMTDDLGDREFRARRELIELCKVITDTYGDREFVEQTEEEDDD